MADIGTLNPEQMLEQQKILRQQKMAEMLMQQGMQQPQGQMVSGRYVAPSIFQNLAGLANTYVGQQGIKEADQAQLKLAQNLREQGILETQRLMNTFGGTPAIAGTPDIPTETYETVKGTPTQPARPPNPKLAFAEGINMLSPQAKALMPYIATEAFKKPEAFTLSADQTRFVTMPDGTSKQVAAGIKKPIQIDTGTAIEFRDSDDMSKVLQRIPKSQMPTAGQVVETANGPMIVNTRTGDAQPIMAGGQPLAPKLSSEQSKDITAINQQRATINGAIDAVEKNKSAFSFSRGVAQNLPYGESLAGRFEKPEDTQARAYVFNNVSSVIKERAGTAQSAQELTRINSFLPATTDNADQVISKLKGFNQYIDDLEKGTRVSPSKKPEAPQSNSFSSEADAQKAFNSGTLKAGQKVTINGVKGTWQ
jgi:hypothetical protein